jgi:hypothetical protein
MARVSTAALSERGYILAAARRKKNRRTPMSSSLRAGLTDEVGISTHRS